MSSSSLSITRLALVVAVVSVLTTTHMCSAQVCCTRTNQLEAIYDGVRVMHLLVQGTNSRFLPESVVKYRDVRTVVGDLLAIMKQKEAQEAEMTDTVRTLIDAVINDSCSYINGALGVTVDLLQCDNSTTVERFYDRLTLASSVINLRNFMTDHHGPTELNFNRGDNRDLYAFWKVNVEDTCSGSACSEFEEVRNRTFNFNSKERMCTCSD